MLILLSEDITLAICPGICNSSESIYIRRVVYHAQFQGFRVAVLNHVGALKNVVVTSPRIFNYGETNLELSIGIMVLLLFKYLEKTVPLNPFK